MLGLVLVCGELFCACCDTWSLGFSPVVISACNSITRSDSFHHHSQGCACAGVGMPDARPMQLVVHLMYLQFADTMCGVVCPSIHHIPSVNAPPSSSL
jgi:hypothetical protein